MSICKNSVNYLSKNKRKYKQFLIKNSHFKYKGSLNSCSASLNTNQVCHPEKVEISLRADDNGTFGFTLQGASMVSPNHDLVQSVPLYPVIGYVEPNSVAERCGILQPGDRILSVNKNSLEGLSLEDARQIIKDAGVNLNLEIEFDVAGKALNIKIFDSIHYF